MKAGWVVRGVSVIAFALALCASGQEQHDRSMETNFQNPPEAAKPRVWWLWMSGNVSKEGITADLEWMNRVGIGGMQIFDGDLGVARYIERPDFWFHSIPRST
jgi:hypothetical protein